VAVTYIIEIKRSALKVALGLTLDLADTGLVG